MSEAGAKPKGRLRPALIWLALIIAVAVPIGAAMLSPLLAWREPIYIAAGLAGVTGLALMLVQPLLAGGFLPGLSGWRGRRVHKLFGAILVIAVIIHVAGLWITSPPDVIDALLFRSPTAFSAWGVIAMWLIFGTAFLAAFRRRLRLAPRAWRVVHTALALVIVAATVVHAVLIEGTMEVWSKTLLCGLVLAAAVRAVILAHSRRQA